MIRRRRKESLTNYKKRIALLKSELPRVIVRRSNRSISMQVAEYLPAGDRILASANSKELQKFQWYPRSNIPTAYLTGLILAKKAKSLKSDGFVLDIGLNIPLKSSVVFAAAKGAVDGGMKISNSIEFDAKRISGTHISSYAGKLKEQGATKAFQGYAEMKVDPAKLHELFENVKKRIMSE
jgi:large subunit ribosomal protein L18